MANEKCVELSNTTRQHKALLAEKDAQTKELDAVKTSHNELEHTSKEAQTKLELELAHTKAEIEIAQASATIAGEEAHTKTKVVEELENKVKDLELEMERENEEKAGLAEKSKNFTHYTHYTHYSYTRICLIPKSSTRF